MGFYAVQSQDVLNQLLSNTSGYADTAAQGTEAMESAAANLAAQSNITTGYRLWGYCKHWRLLVTDFESIPSFLSGVINYTSLNGEYDCNFNLLDIAYFLYACIL